MDDMLVTAQPVGASPHVEMLLDRYLPRFDASRVESRVVDADPEATWEAALDTDLLAVRTPLTTAAFWARGVPEQFARVLGRDRPEPQLPPRVTLGDTEHGLPGWVGLGQRVQQEVAFGAIGRFWTGEITWEDVPVDEFADWSRPGTGKIVANLSLRPYGAARTLVTYEARTKTYDADSRRRFLRYWRLVTPFVGHIMRAFLRDIAIAAEWRTEGKVR